MKLDALKMLYIRCLIRQRVIEQRITEVWASNPTYKGVSTAISADVMGHKPDPRPPSGEEQESISAILTDAIREDDQTQPCVANLLGVDAADILKWVDEATEAEVWQAVSAMSEDRLEIDVNFSIC